jgi:hypothetical protein
MQSMSIQDQLLIWQWILGRYVSIGQTFCNPLRSDKSPGCFLREYQNILLLTDYSHPEYSKYTCIHSVRDLMNCTLHQAAINVYAALYFNKPLQFNNLATVGTIQKGRKSSTKIHFCPWTKGGIPTYTKWDEEYWKDTEVTFEDLRQSNIFSVHHFFMNEKMILPKYPCYAYFKADTGHVKIHQTQNVKEERFIGTTSLNDIWEWNTHNEQTLLTKSVKDGIILSKQLSNWKVICFNNEGTLPDYPRVDVILFDNDIPGINAANKAAKKFNAKPIYFTVAKDSYDVIKGFGIDVLKEELKNII